MEKEIEMLLESSNFYINEATKLSEKIKTLKTIKEKTQAIKELKSLHSKIQFEINQINKILGDQESPYDFGNMD